MAEAFSEHLERPKEKVFIRSKFEKFENLKEKSSKSFEKFNESKRTVSGAFSWLHDYLPAFTHIYTRLAKILRFDKILAKFHTPAYIAYLSSKPDTNTSLEKVRKSIWKRFEETASRKAKRKSKKEIKVKRTSERKAFQTNMIGQLFPIFLLLQKF